MRKRRVLVTASAIAAIGAGLAVMASPASAETFGWYGAQAEREVAMAALGGVNSHGEPLGLRRPDGGSPIGR